MGYLVPRPYTDALPPSARRGRPVRRAMMDEIGFLHRQAQACREEAQSAGNEEARRGLLQLAGHYEAEARRLNLADLARRSDRVVSLTGR